jgi:large subunit ribosomal protein L32
MPPLPKRKYPKSRQGKRRRNIKLATGHVVECPQCRSPRLAHTACPTCGSYHGREAIAVKGPALPE